MKVLYPKFLKRIDASKFIIAVDLGKERRNYSPQFRVERTKPATARHYQVTYEHAESKEGAERSIAAYYFRRKAIFGHDRSEEG